MSTSGTTPSSSSIHYNMEHRDTLDEAWYSVIILNETYNTLRVKYDCVPISLDKVYYVSVERKNKKNWEKLNTLEELMELKERFRPISIQLQDNECHKVVPGLVVCAAFSEKDDIKLKYYDAIVDDVLRKEHMFVNGEEVCHCEFLLVWKHGPCARNLVEKKVQHISLIQDCHEYDLALQSFLKKATENIGRASSMSSPANAKLFRSKQQRILSLVWRSSYPVHALS